MATISMHHVQASMRAAAGNSADCDRLLIGAGINPQHLGGGARRVHTDQVARLFKSIQLKMDDEFMGFTRSRCRVGAFKTMCDLVRNCRTLRELLSAAIEFYRLMGDDIAMTYEVHRGRCIFTIDHHHPELDPDHFLREFLLVIWHRFPSWCLGEAIRLRETHFSFPQPGHHDELKVMFPGVLKYAQDSNRLVFDSKYLDMPLVRSRSEVDHFVRNAPADVMTIPGTDNSLERQIEQIVTSRSSDRLRFPPIGVLSQLLGLSTQALYRRLKVDGTSYQKIKDDIRRERAIKCLLEENLPVETVSEIVGFSEARSFTRAFSHWTGMSPRRYRQAHSA